MASEILRKILEVLDSHPEIKTFDEAAKMAFPDHDVVITVNENKTQEIQ